MRNGYDRKVEYLLNNTPEDINVFLKSQDGKMLDDELMLYLMKFYHLYPNSPLSSYRLFSYLHRIKYYEFAYLVALRGMEKFPEDPNLFEMYSKVAHFFISQEEQVKFAKKWHDCFPESIPAAIYYSQKLFDAEEFKAAEKIIQELRIGKNTYNISLIRKIASFYVKKLEFKKAENLLDEAYIKTDNINLGIDLLSICISNNNFDRAELLLDNFVWKSEEYNTRILNNVLVKFIYAIHDIDIIRRESLLNKIIYFLCREEYSISDFPEQKHRTLLWIVHSGARQPNYIISTIKKFNNSSTAYRAAMFPHKSISITLDMIDVPFLANILVNQKYIKKLADFLNKNRNKIYLKDSWIFYSLLFAVSTNNVILRNHIIHDAYKFRDNLGTFILKIIDKWHQKCNTPSSHASVPEVLSPSASKQVRNLRVALCVAGQLRGFDRAFDSWKTTFHLDEYDTDIYVSTWKNIGRALPKLGQKSRSLPINLYNAIQKEYIHFNNFLFNFPSIIQKFNNKTNIDESDIKNIYHTENIVIEDDSEYPFNAFINNIYKFYYKIFSFTKMIKNNYDIAILVRPDLFIEADYSLDQILNIYYDCINNNIIYDRRGIKSIGYSIGMDDALTFGRFDIMFNLFKIYSDAISNKEIYGYKNLKIRGHYTRYQYFFRNAIDVKIFPLKDISFLDPCTLSAVELKSCMLHDISRRKEIDSDRLLLAALDLDIQAEKEDLQPKLQPQFS